MEDNIDDVSSHPHTNKGLGNPMDDAEYQRCWCQFDKRYHRAIVNYILKNNKWNKTKIDEAEKIVSRVYEKGFRWSFKRQNGKSFRSILKTLIHDCLVEYWQKQSRDKILLDNIEELPDWKEPPYDNDSSYVIKMIAPLILKGYSDKEKLVLKDMLDHNGEWPNYETLQEILGISYDNARQWKSRNKDLWEKFSLQVRKKLEGRD